MNNYESGAADRAGDCLGLTYIVGRSNWNPRSTREFYLCVWLIAAESAYLCIPRPTFGRYYMFVMPFLAMLSAAGLYAIAAQIGSLLLPWRYPLALSLVMASAFVKYSVDALNEYSWKDLIANAAKVEQVTAPGATLYADEHVYFLTKRECRRREWNIWTRTSSSFPTMSRIKCTCCPYSQTGCRSRGRNICDDFDL